jgi:hypothetical protein
MPCTWIGYGEPLPRLPINTGERTENRGGTNVRERGGTEQNREGRRRKKIEKGGTI